MRDIYELATWQWLPRARPEVFAFFADARNLERITPPFLRFHVLAPGPMDMHAGALIDYRLRLRGVPLRWQSEIAAWEPPRRFVDVQRRRPVSGVEPDPPHLCLSPRRARGVLRFPGRRVRAR